MVHPRAQELFAETHTILLIEHPGQLPFGQVQILRQMCIRDSRYTWNFRPDGAEGVVFWQNKIHARHGYRWIHPVHEILQWIGEGAPGPIVTTSGVQLDHHADPKKSRAQYLSLLELATKEDPDDDRCVHYLGREYMFHHQWDDCIQTLLHHLSMARATWPDERAASMRYIALAYLQKGERSKAQNWYLKAITEAPYLREAYVDLAAMLYEDARWDGVLFFTECALAIASRPMSYICEEKAWGSLPYDLRSIAYFRTGRFEQAYDAAEQALAIEPENTRLRANAAFLRKYKAEH